MLFEVGSGGCVGDGWHADVFVLVPATSGTGIRSQLGVKIFGDDLTKLQKAALDVQHIVQQVPGAIDVQMQREGGKPYAEIRLDERKLARFGITAEQVLSTIETAWGGMPLTFWPVICPHNWISSRICGLWTASM